MLRKPAPSLGFGAVRPGVSLGVFLCGIVSGIHMRQLPVSVDNALHP